MKQANLRALLAALALALSAPTPSSAQDAEKKSQEQRIQELEAQVAELQAEHDKAKPEATGRDAEDQKAAQEAAERVRGMSPEERKRWHQGLAASQPANYNAAWHIGTPKRYVDDKGWWGLKGTPSELRLSGWVQFALFHDFQGNALATTQEFSSGAVIVPTLKRPSTGVDVGSSRIFLEVAGVFRPRFARCLSGRAHARAPICGGAEQTSEEAYARLDHRDRVPENQFHQRHERLQRARYGAEV
jgi:hypothetical protein